jgi:hypothetical protein
MTRLMSIGEKELWSLPEGADGGKSSESFCSAANLNNVVYCMTPLLVKLWQKRTTLLARTSV